VRPKYLALKQVRKTFKLQKLSTLHYLTFCNWNEVRERAVRIELVGCLLGTPMLNGRGNFENCGLEE